MKTKIFYIIIIYLVTFKLCNSQQNTSVNNSDRSRFEGIVAKSSLVIEGRVIAVRYYMKGHIYTSAIVRITKLFKSAISDSTIEIVLQNGGMADGIVDVCSTGPHLGTGMEGIFFLSENKTELSFVIDTPSFLVQNFIQYQDGAHRVAHHMATTWKGTTYDDLDKDLFEPLEAVTGKPKILGLNMFERAAANKAKH